MACWQNATAEFEKPAVRKLEQDCRNWTRHMKYPWLLFRDFLITSMSPISNNFSIQFLMNKFDVWIGAGGERALLKKKRTLSSTFYFVSIRKTNLFNHACWQIVHIPGNNEVSCYVCHFEESNWELLLITWMWPEIV